MARPKAGAGGRGSRKAFKDPNKPKRAMSAYFFFMQAYRVQCKSENKDTSKVAEFTKEASKIWKDMDAGQRAKYDVMSERAKGEYNEAMKNYTPPKGMKMKRAKDPNKPKRPPTSYILFLNDFREKNKHTLTHKDVMVKAGEQWRAMNSDAKRPYEERAQVEKKIYDEKIRVGLNGGVAPVPVPAASAPAPQEEEEDDEDMEDDDDEEEDDE